MAGEEAKIERNVCQKAMRRWGIPNSKMETTFDTGDPDRIFWIPGGKPILIEFKRPGEVVDPDSKQAYKHHVLKTLGYNVHVFDNERGALQAISEALDAARLQQKRR